MASSLETAAWIAAIAAIPVGMIGWFYAGSRKTNKARAIDGASAASGDVKASGNTVAFGHGNQITIALRSGSTNEELHENAKRPTSQDTSISFVPIESQCFWHIGRHGDVPSLQIVTQWYVTNTSSVPVRLLSARLIQPRIGDPNFFAVIFSGEDKGALHQHNVAIPPGRTWHVTMQFYGGQPTKGRSQPLDVEVMAVDQFGNEHLAPAVTVRSTG